jgi:transcriptional regulator with XRE-family HTH domain
LLTLEQIQKALADRRTDAVSTATGLHRGTIANVRNGRHNPSYKVMKALSDYLTQEL